MARVTENERKKIAQEKFLSWYKERLPIWKKDPVIFSIEVCGIKPVGEQKEMLKKLAENDKLAVKAGRAVGKSVISGIAALWFITTNYNSLVLITSPNFQQLQDVIFGTIREVHRTSPLLKLMFKSTAQTFRHRELDATWQIVIKTATKGEGIRGYNRPNKLYITDETTGIPEEILDALLGSTDEANSKMLMISNPTRRSGKFYEIFTSPTKYPEWTRVTMSRLVTGYQIIALTSLKAARKALRNWLSKIKIFGKDYPDVRIEILGEFPPLDNKMAFPMELFDSIGRENPFKEKANEIRSAVLGVDIAGQGGDLIVFTLNLLNYDYDATAQRQFVNPKEYFDVIDAYSRANYNVSRDRLIESAKSTVKDLVEKTKGQFKMLYVHIDATGVGSAFLDAVKEALERCTELVYGHELRKWVRVIGTQFQEAAEDKEHYTNRRSEMGEQFKHKLELNQELVSLGKEPIIYINMKNGTMYRGINIEIGNIEKEWDSKARIKYESKDKLRKRLKGASTDIADSLLLSSYMKKPRSLWFIG